MATVSEADQAPQYSTLELWGRGAATVAVAGVAAYASYQHQRDFALAGGADLATAELWPLSVDGLLVLSTAGLLRDARRTSRRARMFLWAAFTAGIIVSLAANIATAPSMSWAPILVAGWPPVALLLAVELLGHRHRRDGQQAEREPGGGNGARNEKPVENSAEGGTRSGTGAPADKVITLAETRLSRHTAEEVMWEHYRRAMAAGLPAPTGAELDAIANTNNYGRAVLRKWRRNGRTGPLSMSIVR
ncbi:MAG TPA: DUF2637 domain-containing protein [Pseudonocardiaceae bacterium]|jgi:hypothetical protein|nr:DUF2637 domain-containing protein [Pseudonocardiaceae bacterium]